MLLQVGLVFFVDYPRTRLLGGRANSPFLSGTLGTVTFDVTKHVLDIVYSQTICWLALFYAPLIVVVTLLKSFVVFYIRLFYVLKVRRRSDDHAQGDPDSGIRIHKSYAYGDTD